MLKNILKKLGEFFTDGEYLSAYRLIMIGWVMGSLIVWIGLNVYSCLALHSVTMVAMHPTILAFLTSLIGGKMIQNYTENRSDNLDNTSDNKLDNKP